MEWPIAVLEELWVETWSWNIKTYEVVLAEEMLVLIHKCVFRMQPVTFYIDVFAILQTLLSAM